MNEVSIDCSQASSMALKCQDGIFSLDNLNFGRASDREFLPKLRAFLQEHGLSVNDIGGWTVGLGPGSFAGIRFSLALVKGICTATKARARGINSSYAIAMGLKAEGRICVLQNARCGMVFVSIYESRNGRCVQANEPGMMSPETVPADCSIYCTPDAEISDALPKAISEKLKIVSPANALQFIDADENDWKWLETPDIEPIYVRPAAETIHNA